MFEIGILQSAFYIHFLFLQYAKLTGGLEMFDVEMYLFTVMGVLS